MEYVQPVKVVESSENLNRNRKCQNFGNFELCQELKKRTSFAKFSDNIVVIIIFEHVVQFNDVWVIELLQKVIFIYYA